MSEVLDKIREQYPDYANVPDQKLALAIGQKYPQYLDHPGFALDFKAAQIAEQEAQPARSPEEAAQRTFGLRQQQSGRIVPPLAGVPGNAPIRTSGGDVLTFPEEGPGLPMVKTPPEAGKVEKVAAGTYNTLASIPNFMLSPAGQVTTMAPVALPGRLAKPALGAVFAPQMVKQASEAAGKASVTGDLQDWTEAASATGLGLLATREAIHGIPEVADILPRAKAAVAALKKGAPNARSQPKATEVHGNVQPQPVSSQGQVPAQESGGGVQPPAQEVAKEAQIPLNAANARGWSFNPTSQAGGMVLEGLTEAEKAQLPKQWEFTDRRKGSPTEGTTVYVPEEATHEQILDAIDKKTDSVLKARSPLLDPQHQGWLDEERKAIDTPVEVVDRELEENEPFAKQIATVDRKTGKILINPQQLSSWLKYRGKGGVPAGQERAAIRSLLSEERIHLATDDKSALDYHDSATAAERAIAQRIYGGEKLSPTLLGHEMLRMRMQQLARVGVREAIEASTRERWTVKSLLAVGDAIRKARETLGTKASKEGLAILDRIQGNLDGVIAAKTGAPAPAARRKVDEKTPGFFLPPIAAGQQRPSVEVPKGPTTNVNLENFDFSKPESVKFVDPELLDRPYSLGRFLTQGTAVAKSPTRTLGTAVVALEKGGKVDLVHAYQDPDDLARVQDPTKTGERTHVSIREMLDRGYKPIAGLMLREPVKNFNQHFESVDEFQKSLGEPAKQAWYKSQQYREGGAIKGTESVTGKAFLNPEQELEAQARGTGEQAAADVLEHEALPQVSRPLEYGSETDDRPGVLASKVGPVTDAEAASLVDHFDLGPATTQGEIVDKINGLTKENRSVISALRKLAAQLDKEHNFLTSEQLIDGLAKRIYENHSNSKNSEDFTKTVIQQGPGRRGIEETQSALAKLEEARAAREASQPGGEQELTTPGRTRPIPRGRMIYRIRPPEPSRMLSPADQAALEARGGTPSAATAPSAAPQLLSQAKPTGRVIETQTEKGPPPIRPPEPMEGPREAERFKREQWLERQDEIRRERLSARRKTLPGEQQVLKGTEPAAIRKFAEEQVKLTFEDIAAYVARAKGSEDDITRSYDSAVNTPNIMAAGEENGVRLQSVSKPTSVKERLTTQWTRGNKEVLAAANVLVQAGFDRSKIADFRNLVDQGRVEALRWSRSNNFRQQRMGRAWLRSNNELMKELDYAEANWGRSDLQATARRMIRALNEQWARERAAGFEVRKDPNYDPQRYDAAIWNEHSMLFNAVEGTEKILGGKFRQPRTFPTYYHAAEAGPYIPVTRDGATLVGHRVRQGMNMIERDAWSEGLKAVNGPSGQPVAIPANSNPNGSLLPPASRDYSNMLINGKAVAVHDEFRGLVDNLSSPSKVQNWPVIRAALRLEQQLKHALLLGDFFHLGRIGYYAASIMGKNAGWRGGWSALDIKPGDINEAVRRGVISQEDADWGNAPVRFGTGAITRRELAGKFVKAGANLGKIQDALYKDLVTDMTPAASPLRRGIQRVIDPTVGRYNRLLFDKLTRGLMTEANVREFERQHAANPTASPEALIKDISRDVNNYFGNIGKQGWVKSATMKDLSRLVFLAPDWLEGLVKKEASFYGRASGVSKLAGRREGVSNLGTTGRGIGRGLVFLFGLNQAINLITRHQPTWQNEEKGHKFDAWIPGRHGEDGFWFSPFSVFNELTHDLWRYVESDPTSLEAIDQVIGNKESPLTRAAIMTTLGATGRLPKPTSSMSQLGMAARNFAPTPLTFGRIAQAAGHAIAPSLVHPNPPGAVQRQGFAAAGLKIEPALSAAQEVSRKAEDFAKANGFSKETGWQQVQTDEPSYYKLRTALRSGDEAEARRQFEAIQKTHTDKQIFHAFKLAKNRPFTGSKAAEKAFIRSLDDQQLERYYKALDQRETEYQALLDFALRQP
jgi:hypothetical protein